MSDLFFNTLEELNKKEQNNLSTRQQNLINRTEEDTTKLSTRQQQLLDAEQQKINERHKNQELYGIEMSDEAYKFWNENVLQFSENPEEDAYKLGTAIRYSEMYDIPLTEAYNNVDMYNEALYGDQLKNTSYRNAFRVISDYWKLGTNEVKINDIGVALRRAKNENDTETYNLLLEQYNLLKQENELLQDNAPRFLTTEAIKFGARLAPFTLVTAGATIAGNVIGLGALTGPAVSGNLMSGGEYINLIEQGISHETAAKVSIATGALQGIIESAIGTSSLFSKLGSKVLGQESGKVINKLGQSIADKCIKEFHFSPFFANVAKTVTGSLINAGEEAIEEATQQITSIIGKNVAAELDGLELDNNTLLDITKEITDAAVGGFLGGLVLGAPGMAINTAIDAREYDKVTKAAGEIQSKKMFKDVTKNSPIFNDLTDEDISKYQDNIYEFYSYKRNEDITEEAKDRAEIFTNDENFEEVTTDEEGNEVIEDVYRTPDGKLFTQNDITETEGNTTKGIFKAGDETKADKNLYGYINYSVNEDNKTVTIDKFNMNYERKSVLNEFYDDFAANFEGYNIEWHPTQSTAQTIKETLINNNPSGKNNGLNYYTELNTKIDQETRTEIARQIKDVYLKNSKRKINNKQLSSLVAFFESGFKTINKDGKYKSFTDFMNNVFSDGETSFKIFGENQEFQNILDKNKARELAQGNAINEQSYTIQGKRGSTLINDLGDGVKATIYVFENGDFSTLAHEVTHIYRRLLPSDLLQKAEEALGITDGRWTEQNDEDFAVGFEEYLRSGKAKNNALKELYDMLAEFFQRVYGALKSIFNVSPELEQVYDELLSGDDSILQQAASAVLEANKKYNTEQKQQKEEQKQNEIQTKEQERLEDSEVYNFNDEEVKAENETQTDEQEKDVDSNIDNELKKDWIIGSLYNVDRNIAEEIADKILDENATLTEKEKAILYAANLNEQGEILALFQGQNILFQEIENEEEIARLESEEKITAYRAMELIDGKLYPPMAGKVDGKLVNPLRIGSWIKADERPDLAIPKINKRTGETEYFFKLKKAGKDSKGKSIGDVLARYNPYWHASLSPLNDQFSTAYKRPTLVTVEVQIPKYELEGKYKAEKAKDSVGQIDWHSGPISSKLSEYGKPRQVILSQFNKVLRVVPDAEVAQKIKEQLEGTDIAIRDDLVPPSLARELEKIGVPIEYTETVQAFNQSILFQEQNIPITLFQLIGTQGASNLDAAEETHYRMNNFQVAVDMTEEGQDAKTIRLATGWEKGVDGKWRYEIDDTKFKTDFVYKAVEFRKENPRYEELENKLEELNYDWEKLTKEEQEEFEKLSDKFNEGYYKNEATLEEILDAPELYKAYPELKKAVVKFKYNPGEVAGKYLHGKIIDEFFEIEENYHEIEINTLPNSDNEEKIKSHLLHEIQHAIQRIEGFATGGNPEIAGEILREKEEERKLIYNKAMAWVWKRELEAFEKERPELSGQLQLMDELINDYKENETFTIKQLEDDHWIPHEKIRNKGFNLYVRGYDKEGYEDAYNEWSKNFSKYRKEIKDTEVARYDIYRAIAGEVEARNVQTRMTLTPEERKQKLLAETMDIARDQQIIMFQTLQDEAQQAIENVREQYINTDKWLKAPNGNDTNLTEKQWLQVRTPQFKAWFGDWENDPDNASKVVDENGEPLVVYHGTSYQFDEFVSDEIGKTTNNKGIFGNGFYFSNSKEMANYYTKFDKTKEGKVLNTYLNIKKPFIWSEPKNLEVAKKLGFPKNRIRDNKLLPLNDNEKIIKFTKKLKDAGYDGVIFNYPKSYSGFGDNNVNETVAFYPNQIKSATDNSGEFSADNPSILHQTAYHGSPHNFDRFTTDAIGTGEGAQSFGWGLYFTNQEDIARWYADKLTFSDERRKLLNKKEYLKTRKKALRDVENKEKYEARILRNLKNEYKELNLAKKQNNEKDIAFYERLIKQSEEQLNNEEYRQEIIQSLQKDVEQIQNEIKELEKEIKTPKRNLYTVELSEGKYLYWDKIYSGKEVSTLIKALREEIEKNYSSGSAYINWDLLEEIENSKNFILKGEYFYENIASIFNNKEKLASEYLRKIGYIGIDYPAQSLSGNIEEGKRNYVIFDDTDVKITEHILFQTQQELIDDAKSFESWQDFMEYYETFGIPEVSPIPNDADSQWYQTFWELAKGLIPEQQTNEQIQQQQIESDNNSDNSPAEMDALWLATVIDDDTNFDDFIEQLRQIKTNADLNKRMLESGELESAGLTEEDIKQINDELEQYDYMLKRVRHGSFISGIVGKNELKDTHKEMIRKLIRKEPRTYREIYSILMNDSQWEVAEEDKLSTQIKTNPLANPNVDYDNLSAEQLRRYADELQNKEIAEKVKNKTVLMNDEVEKYIDSLNKEIKTLNSKLKENEQDRNEENRTIADYQERQLLKLYDELLHAKINYKNKSDEIARRIEKGIKITKKYQNDVQNAKANYDTIFRKWEDLRKATEITAQVKEAMTKREVVAELRENIKGKQKEKRILEDIKKMKVQLVKRTMRRVPFTRIDYNNARALIAIQRIFEPNLMGQVNEWIGQDREFLRSFVSKWITDNDFRELIKTNFNKKLTKGRQRLLELLEKTNSESDFINWTTQERKLAHRLMPKENWIKELNLETLAEEREGSIQLDIDFIEERKIVYDPIKKQDVEFVITRPVISEELETEVKDYLGVDLFNQVINKPFATWTIAEMETLAKRVDEIYTEGRDILKNKREIEKERINEIREKIRATIKDTGIVINDDDDEKTKQQKIEKINKILGKNSTVKGTLADKESGFFYKLNSILNGYADANIHRVTRILDNYSEGINTSELYAKENTCYNLKERAIRERNENISKLMQENNITLDELYNSVTIAGQTYTIDELLYIIAANKDYVEKENANLFNDEADFYNLKNNDDSAPTARNAVMFGNLLSSQDMLEFKESCKREDEEMLRKIENGELTLEEKALLQINQLDRTPGTSSYISACKLQMERILSYTENLDPKFTKLLDAIELDYSTQYDKMNKVSIDIFNAPVWRVKHYVPLIRLESNGETNENRVKEDLLGTAGIGKQYVDKGMTQKRKHIGALNQKPVEMGLYKTWIDSVERTEHFIAYSGYVKELNAVYKNRDSQFLRQYIENRYGRNMIKYIDAYINEVANPDANKVRTSGDEILRTLRGKTAPAYLAWKASGIIKQAATSPWPFMQFVTPIEYLSSCFKCFDPKIQDAIKNKSVFMKNRVMDPMNELVDEMSEKKTNKVEHAINKFNKIGMQGLEAIDWACVAPGWLACYNKEYTRLQKENENIFILTKQQLEEENYNIDFNSPSYLTNEQIIKKATEAQKSEAEIEMMAINYADDCTRLSQPSSRVVDLAPLYKQNSEAWKTLLQFQTSLNVIWQNIKYDLPYSIKQKEFKQIIGAIMGYLFAGLTVNAITAGFTDGDDDDENDTENAIKKALFYSTTQFSDAIPIIGSAVTNMTEKIVTGKSSSYSNNTNMMPMINTLIQAGQYSIDKEKWDKAAKKYLEAIGLATGLPVSGTKELLYTVGIGDNEEGLEFKPEAIIGRRK